MHDLILPEWPAPANVRAFSTTRTGGVSQAPWNSLNLGYHCGDNPHHVEQNRQSLLARLPSEPRWLKQVHGIDVVTWDGASATEAGADAIIAIAPDQVCAVLTADCLPVLFCDSHGSMVAAAHAGWRGLVSGVLEATVAAMECEASHLMAWLGPAIGPQAFEVGDDVHAAFVGQNNDNAMAFKAHGKRWLADLYLLARLALTRVGVRQVYAGDYCTYSDADRFFSYRRDGETGRMASVIWLVQ